jgi:purine-nucleoside phosphorylase
MSGSSQQVKETANFLVAKFLETPRWVIVLGSGLSSLPEKVQIKITIPYKEIPYYPSVTVEGHSGELV